MNSFAIFPFVILAAMVAGVCGAFFTRRVPSHGWVGVLLLLLTALTWILIDAGEDSRPSSLPIAAAFGFIAPVAVVYSFRSRRRAPDKLTALAAFVGSFIIAGFFLFMFAGLALWIYEIFTHTA